jgi:ATP-dependent Lon protease
VVVTPTGGDVLFVEATMMPSNDERLLLTGMLGDVMPARLQPAASRRPPTVKSEKTLQWRRRCNR